MDFAHNRNLKIFTISNTLMAFAFGLFGPFYIIFINDIGGSIENFGIAMGLVVLSGAVLSIVAGKYSDLMGRKPLLIMGGYASAIVVLLYTFIDSLWQLYALQVISGLIISVFETSESAYLADITKKQKRGADVGKYSAYAGFAEAIAIFAGGFLARRFGFEIIFYAVSIIFIIATTIMFTLSERRS